MAYAHALWQEGEVCMQGTKEMRDAQYEMTWEGERDFQRLVHIGHFKNSVFIFKAMETAAVHSVKGTIIKIVFPKRPSHYGEWIEGRIGGMDGD